MTWVAVLPEPEPPMTAVLRLRRVALGGRHLEVLPGVAVGVWGHLPAGGPACGPVFLAFAPVALAHTPPVEVEQADRARAAQSA